MSLGELIGSIFPHAPERAHRKSLLLALEDVKRHIERGHYTLAEQGMEHMQREMHNWRDGRRL